MSFSDTLREFDFLTRLSSMWKHSKKEAKTQNAKLTRKYYSTTRHLTNNRYIILLCEHYQQLIIIWDKQD